MVSPNQFQSASLTSPKASWEPRGGLQHELGGLPIDALAVARAALREPSLPTAYLDDDAREVRLLVDHREDLIGERTRQINRLRWHLHEIDPTWDPKQRALTTKKHLAQTQQRLAETTTVLAKIAADRKRCQRRLKTDPHAASEC